ncbi:putative aminotransferase [Mizugakiibacter sediminis]|uniref:Putative aminotransferase n=1 Tax=Mizugakiibacter sediminis TaxID=1475481 RepID=A0A0K8QKJ1_9GAMM|nr:alpha-hydroxyketone-type quorum-sensing autoinducer synthase [Mizugakiibacter sediminis]GAP65465.1 putative aminotransferase [Mizugakiibacter sediminis]
MLDVIDPAPAAPEAIVPLRPATPRPAAPALPELLRERVEHFRRERVQLAWGGKHIMLGSVPRAGDLVLQSNDYLAITRHPEIVRAQCAALENEGNGMMMSGIFLQHAEDPMRRLEQELAGAMGAEEGMLCQSGYNANVGLVQSIAGERTPVYVDMLAHASLWEGVKSAGARAVAILHNDPEHLERQVLRNGPGVILVDAVYSTTGALCPLAAYADIAARHDCVLVVDESHSLGTHGSHGEGLVASLGLGDRVHFRTVSLAKTYCARAGLITCPAGFREYLASESLPAIFSSTLLPHELAGIGAAHRVIQAEGWRRNRLRQVTQRVRTALTALGYPIANGTEQIVGLEIGPERLTMHVRDVFEAHGVFGSIFCAPATAKNRSLLRLTLNAGLNDAEVERLIETLASIRNEIDLVDWSGTRRQRRGGAATLDHVAVA